MKPFFTSLLITLALESIALGQGTVTYIYDQQSADESTGGGTAVEVQPNQPLGQSFIPTLSSVGFIRLVASDGAFNDVGTTMSVNLRSASITGPILGSTAPVFLPDRFGGPVDFFFTAPVTVTPSVTYYFQPVIEAGDSFRVRFYNYNYPGGTAFALGVAGPNTDLWFREGIVVPEPSSAWLALFGAGVFASLRRWKSRRSHSHP